MRHARKLIADPVDQAGHDGEHATADAEMPPPGSPSGPIHGFVIRHGQTVPYTLDTSQPLPEPQSIVPEQLAMGAVVLASFTGAILRLLA